VVDDKVGAANGEMRRREVRVPKGVVGLVLVSNGRNPA